MQSRTKNGSCGFRASSKEIATGLSALSHPVRIEILKQLSGADACCCKDIVGRVDLAQSTVSQHLKILVEAGLVRFATDRQRSRYEIDRLALSNLSDSLAHFIDSCTPVDPATGVAKGVASHWSEPNPK